MVDIQTHIGPKGGLGGLTFLCDSTGAMGEKRLGVAPGIAWSNYTTPALLQSIQDIVVELSARDQTPAIEGLPSSTTPGAAASASSGASSSQGLKAPWSCGYRCQWCERACTRKEGHSRHSCYDCRYKK